jgi:uncharacterized protein with PQ loop repeat
MHLHDLAVMSGYVGSAFGVSMVLPQISRTFRNRAVGGVSPTSWSLTAIACLTWLLYGVRTGETPQIPGNVLLVAGACVIVLAVPARVTTARRAAALGSAAGLITAFALVAAPAYVGYLALSVGLIAAWPQTIESIARAREGAESAVSISAWVLRALSQLCWLGYAVVLHDVPVTVGATVTLTSAVALLVAELRRQSVSYAAAVAA